MADRKVKQQKIEEAYKLLKKENEEKSEDKIHDWISLNWGIFLESALAR